MNHIDQRILEKLDAVELKSLFHTSDIERSYILERSEDYAGWTLPHLFLGPHIVAAQEEMQHDYQALGAQLVNNLANKIVTTLFQPGRPFFRLDLDDKQVLQMVESGIEEVQIEELLSKAEAAGMREMAKANIRTAVLQAIKSLIVVGNSLMFFPEGGVDNKLNAQVYSLLDYTTARAPDGSIKMIITRDTHIIATLPEDIHAMIPKGSPDFKPDDKIELFTAIVRSSDDRFVVWQELDDLGRLPRKIGKYTHKDLPWIPLTWNLSRGNNYGTGQVEEYAGDFHSYSMLSESVNNLAAIASDIKILVNPLGSTEVDDLNSASMGDYVSGRAEDISYLQLEKTQDANFIDKVMESYARRLGAGFLFNAAVTRQAERVTAEEIRMQANELEGSLGGIYSRLAEDMQLPIARRVMEQVGDGFKDIEPVIVTGIESLSRTTELDQIMLFFGDLARLTDLPPEAEKRLDYQGVIPTLASARRVEYKNFLLTEEQVKAEEQRIAKLTAATQAASRPQPPAGNTN